MPPPIEAEALAVPLDHGGRFDQDHGVQNLGLDPVKPYPEQPVSGEELRPAGALAPQDRHLMPQGDKLEFQRGTATKAEREQRDEG